MRIPTRCALFSAISLLAFVACNNGPLLAESSKPVRYLVIHADDAGMSHSVNMATIEAIARTLDHIEGGDHGAALDSFFSEFVTASLRSRGIRPS